MPGINTTVIHVRVLPRSSKNQVADIEASVYKIKLTAPPVNGKANKALQQFLSKKLGIPKTSIKIISGEKSRVKAIRIQGLSEKDIAERLKNGDGRKSEDGRQKTDGG